MNISLYREKIEHQLATLGLEADEMRTLFPTDEALAAFVKEVPGLLNTPALAEGLDEAGQACPRDNYKLNEDERRQVTTLRLEKMKQTRASRKRKQAKAAPKQSGSNIGSPSSN